ncbi:MAG: hypothetical protein GC199_09025 [Alphaproteobacteria bacterium]|nr:hypothetical protein [Alphaproteobacteria bacterium]
MLELVVRYLLGTKPKRRHAARPVPVHAVAVAVSDDLPEAEEDVRIFSRPDEPTDALLRLNGDAGDAFLEEEDPPPEPGPPPWDPDHLAALKQGREAWNAFVAEARMADPQFMANLQGVRFDAATFEGTTIWGQTTAHGPAHVILDLFDLAGANLKGAHFGPASLARANLSKATLGKADLRGANLARANLKGAFLQGADLRGAMLKGANLADATTERARFTGARV